MDLRPPPSYDPVGQWTARAEQSDLPHRSMAWTSFDRHDRYGAVVTALRRGLGPGRHRVLDVGDSVGYLAAFDDELDVSCIDPRPEPGELPGATLLAGQGQSLPFGDRSFDAVVSVDALEHVPPDKRPAFLRELVRVSDGMVVIACPFDTPGVAVTEELVRRFALHVQREPQVQLDEHAANGLPQLDDVVAVLRGETLEVEVEGNGNLLDWLALMLIKFRLDTAQLRGLGIGVDLLYNGLSQRATTAPYYRHAVIASRRPIEPRVEPARTTDDVGELGATWAFLATMMSGEVAASGLQEEFVALHGDAVGIHDLVQEFRSTSHGDALGIFERLGIVHEDLRTETVLASQRVEAVEKRLEQLGRELDLVGDELAQTRQALHGINEHLTHLTTSARHPLRTILRRIRG